MIYITGLALLWIIRRLWRHETNELMSDFRLAFQATSKLAHFAIRCLAIIFAWIGKVFQPSSDMQEIQPKNI